jgi:hypothetical protein
LSANSPANAHAVIAALLSAISPALYATFVSTVRTAIEFPHKATVLSTDGAAFIIAISTTLYVPFNAAESTTNTMPNDAACTPAQWSTKY